MAEFCLAQLLFQTQRVGEAAELLAAVAPRIADSFGSGHQLALTSHMMLSLVSHGAAALRETQRLEAQLAEAEARPALLRSWANFQAPSQTRMSHSAC